MPRQQIVTDRIGKPSGHFAQANAIEARGRFVFISGMTSKRADGSIAGVGDIEAQTRQMCENVKAAVEAAGGSMADICRVDVYVKDMSGFDIIHRVRREYFPSPPPASTMVAVSGFTHPDYLIEMAAIAVIPDSMDTIAHGLFVPPVPMPPPAPLPLRAFLRAIRENALTIWPEAAYHDDVMVRQFFGRKNYLLNAPEAIHHVLVDNHANYRRSPASIRILRPITGNGLLLSMGEAWRLQRRTIAPALGPRVIPLLSRHIMAATQEALATLDQPQIDMLAFMQTLALDIAGRSMFSLETRQYGAVMRRLLTEFAEHLAQPHLFDMLLPPSIPTLRDWRRARFSKRWMHLIETMMQQRAGSPEPGEKPRDLFDLLIGARDPETGAGFSRVELRDQVATLILAGHETTAVTLFWACMLLAKAPDIQDWMAGELSGIDLTEDGAQTRLIRTRAVVNETLRLFPAAFTLVHETILPDQIGSLQLPRRSVLMIAPWVLHRHHAYWTDPGAFNPARFMPDAPPPPRFAFMPFGAGPRICVGAQFAMAEAVLVLASLIQRFHISLNDTVMPVAVVTTQPDHAPLFQLTRRTALSA